MSKQTTTRHAGADRPRITTCQGMIRRGDGRGRIWRLIPAGMLALLLFSAHAVWSSPQIMHWQTTGGSRVYFVESHELPIIDIRLLFDAGSTRDPAGKNGLAVLVNSLLDEGADGLGATEISFEFERLGAQYRAEAGYDSASVSLRSLSEQAIQEPALRNLRRVITAPTFLAKAVERQKQRVQLGIQRKQQSPAEIARDAYMAAIYQDHPYAHPNDGTLDSVASLNREDIIDFHRRFYTARNAMLVLVGDLTRDQAETLAEELTGALAGGQEMKPLPAVAQLEQQEEVRIEHPSSQVHILVGQPGIRRGDPDYFPLYVGNHILGGGGFVARLYDEVREKRGLSYSAYSYFSPRRENGPFIAGLQTRGDQRKQALQVMRETIRTFIDKGPTPEELDAAGKNITGGFPLRLDSNSKILGYVAMIGFYGLPLDYLDTFIKNVNAVTIGQIRDAFQRRLQPDRFVTVMVGPIRSTAEGEIN